MLLKNTTLLHRKENQINNHRGGKNLYIDKPKYKGKLQLLFYINILYLFARESMFTFKK